MRRFRASLWFCGLATTVMAFPLMRTRDRTSMVAKTPMHMRLPTIRAAWPNQQEKAKVQELWYRDRSTAEEQMTHSTPHEILPTTTQTLSSPPCSAITTETETTDASRELLQHMMGDVDLSLVEATCWSHAKLLAVAWVVLSLALVGRVDATSPLDFWSAFHWNAESLQASVQFHPLLDWTITPLRLLQGILATIPLVAMGTLVGHSEHASACHIHLSITNTVIAFFGRRRRETEGRVLLSQDNDRPEDGTTMHQVLFFSLLLGTVSAISQELVFRGILPTALASYTHSVEVALLGQAMLYGLGQVRQQSSLAENGGFSMMQALNGLWYGTVYLGTGGDIVPVMVAHILYECHIFVGAWKMINDQLDYTEITSANNEDKLSDQLELDIIRREAGESLKPETLDFCRRFFYAFDYEHQGSLSLSNVKRAVAYAFLHDPAPPSDAKTAAVFDQMIQLRDTQPGERQNRDDSSRQDKEDRLTLSEFLRLLFALKSKRWTNQVA